MAASVLNVCVVWYQMFHKNQITDAGNCVCMNIYATPCKYKLDDVYANGIRTSAVKAKSASIHAIFCMWDISMCCVWTGWFQHILVHFHVLCM